jgi:hypothetical protein
MGRMALRVGFMANSRPFAECVDICSNILSSNRSSQSVKGNSARRLRKAGQSWRETCTAWEKPHGNVQCSEREKKGQHERGVHLRWAAAIAAAHAEVLHMPAAFAWRRHGSRCISSGDSSGKNSAGDSPRDSSKGFSWRVNHMVSIPSSFSEKGKEGSVEETASWRFNHMVTTKRIVSMQSDAQKKVIEPSKAEVVREPAKPFDCFVASRSCLP